MRSSDRVAHSLAAGKFSISLFAGKTLNPGPCFLDAFAAIETGMPSLELESCSEGFAWGNHISQWM